MEVADIYGYLRAHAGELGARIVKMYLGSQLKAATSVTTGFLLANAPPEQVGKRSGGFSEAYRDLIEHMKHRKR